LLGFAHDRAIERSQCFPQSIDVAAIEAAIKKAEPA